MKLGFFVYDEDNKMALAELTAPGKVKILAEMGAPTSEEIQSYIDALTKIKEVHFKGEKND